MWSEAAQAAWVRERETQLVDSAIEMIRVYQYKMPDGIGPLRGGPWPQTWWSTFTKRLERTTEEREFFCRSWTERHAPGGYQQTLDQALGVDHERHPYIRAGQQTLPAFG